MICRRCKAYSSNKGLCRSCLSAWSDMRTLVWKHCEEIYGKITPESHPFYIKEMKRLEKIWKKDPSLLEKELLSQKRNDKIDKVIGKN